MTQRSGVDRIEPRKKPQQERSVRRVDMILSVATTLIARHGVSRLKMTEIAREANIPVGSVYQYFPEKAAIIKALFDRLTQRVQARTAETFADVRSSQHAVELICGIVDWYYAEFRQHPADIDIWLGTETDQDLMRLNIADSRATGALFHTAVEHCLAPEDGIDMDARAFMMSHLTGSAVRLAVMCEDTLAQRILKEWKAVIRQTVFAPAAR